jgi:hypothetical protein
MHASTDLPRRHWLSPDLRMPLAVESIAWLSVDLQRLFR